MDESLEKATHAVVARSSAETGATVGYRIRHDRPVRINFLFLFRADCRLPLPTLVRGAMRTMVVILDAVFSICSMKLEEVVYAIRG